MTSCQLYCFPSKNRKVADWKQNEELGRFWHKWDMIILAWNVFPSGSFFHQDTHKQWYGSGSGFIWVRGSGSGSTGVKSLIKWRGKQSLTNKNLFFFAGNYIFQVWTLKKVGSAEWLRNVKFLNFLKFKEILKIWRFYWPGSGSGIIKFCGSGYNQSGSTSLPINVRWWYLTRGLIRPRIPCQGPRLIVIVT